MASIIRSAAAVQRCAAMRSSLPLSQTIAFASSTLRTSTTSLQHSRAFSAEATASATATATATTPVNNQLVATTASTTGTSQLSFISSATRTEALGRHLNIRIKPRKLNDLCRLVRGLSVAEAVIQCNLSRKSSARTVAKCIENAAMNGVNNFNMERTRLYVAEAVIGKADSQRIPDYKAKGSAGIIELGCSHLRIIVKEQQPERSLMPYNSVRAGAFNAAGEEIRIGRFGRKSSTIQRTLLLLKTKAEKAKAVEEAKKTVAAAQ